MSQQLHVFTYGSLMFDPVWSMVVSQSYRHHVAELPGFSRHAVRNELYPALLRCASAANGVKGRLYRDISAEDLLRLDTFEGSEYQRVACQVIAIPDGPNAVYATEATKSTEVTEATEATESSFLAKIDAQVYLFLKPELLLPQDWDEANFAARGIKPFMATYCPKP